MKRIIKKKAYARFTRVVSQHIPIINDNVSL